jgi:LemA protein
MKHPWLTFAGLCAVVLAIVMICVIFGSYTSMLRSKNRIHAAKNLMVTACRNQLSLIPELLSLAPEAADQPVRSRIGDASEQIRSVLTRFQTSDTPLDPNLMAEFEQAHFRLARDLDILARRYNKEVTYFHTRKKVFPGMFTAGWFNLDTLRFPEIDPACFEPWGLK